MNADVCASRGLTSIVQYEKYFAYVSSVVSGEEDRSEQEEIIDHM